MFNCRLTGVISMAAVSSEAVIVASSLFAFAPGFVMYLFVSSL